MYKHILKQVSTTVYFKEHKKLPHALLVKTQTAPLGMVSLKYLKICFNPLQQRCI